MSNQTKYNRAWAKKQHENGMCINCKNPHLKNQMTCAMCYMKLMAHRQMGDRKFAEELYNKLIAQDFKCYITGRELELGLNASIDHIISKSVCPEKSNDVDNMSWCDIDINRMKNCFSYEVFLEMCKEVTDYNKLIKQ